MSVLEITKNTFYDFQFALYSGDGDEYPDCHLSCALWKWHVSLKLPAIITPEKWGSKYTERVYGFSIYQGFLDVNFGRRAESSGEDQRWGYFLPWLQYRHVRHSLYGRQGEHVWTEVDRQEKGAGVSQCEEYSKAKESLAKATFNFTDVDGEEIVATTCIEEREWHRGTGWWKWVSWLYQPKIRRDLDIDFSKEVGPRKGEWKGGILRHSIEMLHPAELHEHAFRRYCEKYKLTFAGTRV